MSASADRRRFDRRSRLRTRRDFDDAFQGGRKLVNRQLVLWYRPAPGDRSRVGLSVSRRVGGAVQRNRVKRCLRAAFRKLARDLDPPLDMVLIARPGQPPRDGASAEQALAHLLRRLRREQAGQERPRRSPGAGAAGAGQGPERRQDQARPDPAGADPAGSRAAPGQGPPSAPTAGGEGR